VILFARGTDRMLLATAAFRQVQSAFVKWIFATSPRPKSRTMC
jgi:hypothetical protein